MRPGGQPQHGGLNGPLSWSLFAPCGFSLTQPPNQTLGSVAAPCGCSMGRSISRFGPSGPGWTSEARPLLETLYGWLHGELLAGLVSCWPLVGTQPGIRAVAQQRQVQLGTNCGLFGELLIMGPA
jgi:hypothetical protein